MAATIAAVAAILAVLVGILNVALTGWFNARNARESWHRERIHPLIVAVVAASDRHAAYAFKLLGPQDDIPAEQLNLVQDEAHIRFLALEAAVAELAIVASPGLEQAASRLESTHIDLMGDPDSSSYDDLYEQFWQVRTTFLAAAKTELRITPPSHRRLAPVFRRHREPEKPS
jgi:hypothetical protein